MPKSAIEDKTTKRGAIVPAYNDGKEWRFLGRIKTHRPKLAIRPFGNYLIAKTIPSLDLKSIGEYDRYQNSVPILDQGQIGCHDDKTEVLTEHGWKLFSEYDRKSLVGTMNQFNGQLEFQLPTAFHAYDIDSYLYYSINRCVDFAVSCNHRMLVKKWNQRKRTLEDHFEFVSADNMGWYFGLPHATSGYNGVELGKVKIGQRWMSGDSFVALVALVISNGWVGSTENNYNRVSFCCFNEKYYDMVAKVACKLGFTNQPNRQGNWLCSDVELAQWFRDNAFIGHDSYTSPYKRVPDIIKTISSRQVKLFLDFFMDKHVASDGSRDFFSSSQRMIDDLQELLLHIGKRGTIGERVPRKAYIKGREIEPGYMGYNLGERTTDRLSIDKKDHIVEDRYKGTIFCASVPNSTLVTRRNGSILISGNSCTAHATTTALEKVRDLAGQTYVALSADSLYAQINNDQDQGSDPADAITALQQNGICTLEEVPDDFIYWRNIPQKAKDNAKRFRISANGVYQCANFNEMVTADYLGFGVTLTICVGNNFEPTKRNNYVVGYTPGAGNHCIAGGEAFRFDSKGNPQYRFRNSWTTQWGQDGCAWLTPMHIDNQPYLEIYAIQWALDDPQDPSNISK
jgi:hypothetical protein